MTYINRQGVYNCMVCGKPVLCIEGEYRIIDTYNMSERLVEAGAFGDIHVACMSQSVFEPDWHELTLHRYMVIYEMDGEALHRGGMLFSKKETFFYYAPDHSLVKFTLKDLGSLKQKGEYCFLKRTEPLELTFTSNAYKEAVLNGLSTNKILPVWPLAQHLSIDDKFCQPGLMREARFLFDRTLAQHWDFGSYWCLAEKEVMIDARAIEMIRASKR